MDTPSIRQIRQSSFRSRNPPRRNVSGPLAIPIVEEDKGRTIEEVSDSTSSTASLPKSSKIRFNPAPVPSKGSRRGSISDNDFTHSLGLTINPITEPKSGVVDLTKTSRYCVSKLPATPSILKESINLDSSDFYESNYSSYKGSSDPTTNFALISNEAGAYVWTYTSPDQEPAALSFPYDSPNTLSILVAPAPGTQEPGLVNVVPDTGKLTYYESVGGAIANELLTTRKHITHEIKLYGESISHIQAIEPVGLVVTTTSGRFILVTLRDLYGKQLITSTTMRGGGTGFLSSLKNAVVPSRSRRDIVSIKPGPITGRTERQVLFINRAGDLSIWECSRNGARTSRVLFDGRLYELMLNAISETYTESFQTFKVHDVELYSEERTLFVLSSFEFNDDKTYYFLFTFLMEDGDYNDTSAQLLSAHRLQSFTGESCTEPRLIFPKPHNTIFVVFSEAIVLLDSKVAVIDTNEERSSRRWEDVISFKSGIEIIGSNGEDLVVDNAKTITNCGIIALIRNVGVVRVEIFKNSKGKGTGDLLKRETSLESELAKSRIEQAVFFGSEDGNNPLSFTNRSDLDFKDDVLEESFLVVSKEILETKSVYMPIIRSSLVEHLALRVLYLSRLAQYLHDNFVRVLSVEGKYRLLWDLEKATAAEALWGYIDSKLQEGGDNILLRVIGETEGTNASGDVVREWFINKVSSSNSERSEEQRVRAEPGRRRQKLTEEQTSSIDKILIEVSKRCTNSPLKERVIEGNNAIILSIHDSALATRHKYREQIFYLFPNDFCNLKPWTSSLELLTCVENQYKLTVKLINNGNGNASQELESQLVTLTEILCAIYTERIVWVYGGNLHSEISSKFSEDRIGWIRLLVKLGYSEDALRIAEQFQIYRSLVEISINSLNIAKRAGDEVGAMKYSNKIERYFEMFGYEFANVLYQYFIETKQLKSLLTEFPTYNHYLDGFLSTGRHGRISWIRDIQKGNYSEAGRVLSEIALDKEDLNSNRKLQLSIAKLSNLASNGYGGQDNETDELITAIEARIQTINIQESILTQVEGYVNDNQKQRYQVNSNDLLNSVFVDSLPIHKEIVKKGLSKITQTKKLSGEELIDILTLIDETSKDSKLNYLRAFELVGLPGVIPDNKTEINEALIWIRLLLQDDWRAIVNTKKQSDAKVTEITEQTKVYQTLRELYMTNISTFSKAVANNVEILVQNNEIDESTIKERYSSLDEYKLNEFSKEFAGQIEELKDLIGNYGLSNWIKGIAFTIREGMEVDKMK